MLVFFSSIVLMVPVHMNFVQSTAGTMPEGTKKTSPLFPLHVASHY